MKKLILKTALITLIITLILAVAVFGILSFSAPAAMMNFTASLGMDTISADYAFQEYERSGSLSHLSRSFLVAAEHGQNRKADERFTILYGEEGSTRREAFATFCAEYVVDSSDLPAGSVAEYNYRGYLCGQAAVVKYRLAKTEEARRAVCAFAIAETPKNFPAGNPAIALTLAVAEAKDGVFGAVLLDELGRAGFENNQTYQNIVDIIQTILEEIKS